MNENERAAAVADRVVEEAFLSPRVVDAATLSEFAGSLGELIRRAAEQREHLRRTVAEGENVAATLRDATGQAGEKLRPALKLIPTIDQKLAQAEQAMSRAAEAAQTAERAAGEAARAVTAEGAVALRAAQAALDEALERARVLESRLGQLSHRAEEAIERLDRECRERLDAAARHAQDVLGTTVAEIDARAEQTLERLGSLIEDRRAAAEAALAEPLAIGRPRAGGGESAEPPAPCGLDPDRVLAATQDAREEVESLMQAARAQVREHIGSLEAEARRAEQRAAEAGARAHEADSLAAAAEERLAAVRRELASVDQRGREIASMASQALAAFDDELTGRMHAVREMMEQLASLTSERTQDQTATALPPAQATEPKPAREPAFIRIDRPTHAEAPGLPGRLRI